MIKSEKKIQIIELPYYYLKLMIKKVTKMRVNATSVSCFDDYGDEIVIFYDKRDIKLYQSKFQIFDELHFAKTKSISIRLEEKKSFKYLYRNYLEIVNTEGLPVDDKMNIILDGYYKRPFRKGKLKKVGLFSIKYHANMMLGSFFKPVNKTKYKNALILTSRWSENYYHWMTEILPRLALILKMNHEIDIVIINQIVNQFQKDTLKYIDIKQKIVETKSKHIFEVQNGIIPELDNIDSYKINFLRKSYKKLMIKDTSTLLYISRTNSQSRKIKNEEELKNILEKLGIKTVKFEEQSFEQQVKTIYNASLIISTHGAGLTNLIFAQPGTKVIEFIPEKRFAQHFIKISNILNLRHFIIKYRGDSNYNLRVNVNKFETFLRRVIST